MNNLQSLTSSPSNKTYPVFSTRLSTTHSLMVFEHYLLGFFFFRIYFFHFFLGPSLKKGIRYGENRH